MFTSDFSSGVTFPREFFFFSFPICHIKFMILPVNSLYTCPGHLLPHCRFICLSSQKSLSSWVAREPALTSCPVQPPGTQAFCHCDLVDAIYCPLFIPHPTPVHCLLCHFPCHSHLGVSQPPWPSTSAAFLHPVCSRNLQHGHILPSL